MINTLINNYLDKLVRPEFRFFNRSWHAFQVCGYTGLTLCIGLSLFLATYLNLSLWILTGVIGVSVLTFLALAMATKMITGSEKLIYYHHEIAIILAVALYLQLLNQAVLPYLDITILAVGTFLFCGRVGCFMVGCCHGQPHKFGVRYRQEHADAGFTHYYVGIRLFPIQIIESLWVFAVVLIGIGLMVNGRTPGEALAWYVIMYDIGRFTFELVRGDPDRPYHLGFSEGQWISVILMGVVVGLELTGTLLFHPWHLIATIIMVVTMIGVTLKRRQHGSLSHQLSLPRHVKEIAAALQEICHASLNRTTSPRNGNPENIRVATTSLGIRLSTQTVAGDTEVIRHFAISSQKTMMDEKEAKRVADVILKLRYPRDSGELKKGNQGVFHLLIHPLVKKNGHPVPLPEPTAPKKNGHSHVRQELVNGLLYSHGRMNTNTQLAFKAQARLTALIQMLGEKGVISAKDLEKQTEISSQTLSKDLQSKGVGVMMLERAVDKYSLKAETKKIDCSKRIHLCRAACCRLSFALSEQDILEGVVRWNLGHPYVIAHGEDGYCSHMDRDCLGCQIYPQRPGICRTYDCSQDKRIWLDFANRIINPDVTRSDWPSCVKPENVEAGAHG